jgi:hypothetical protein
MIYTVYDDIKEQQPKSGRQNLRNRRSHNPFLRGPHLLKQLNPSLFSIPVVGIDHRPISPESLIEYHHIIIIFFTTNSNIIN